MDEQLRSRINENKSARSKVPYKSVEDIDRQIERLDKDINGGMMKLVDEKKALAEVSNLKKQRKNFAQFDAQQKEIDALRAKIKEVKDSMDDPESKAMSEQYNKIQAELDGIKAEQDEAYKNLSGLRDERSKLHNEQREKFDAIRKAKDEYYAQKKAFTAYEREAKQKAWERKQAERDRFEKEKKKERAQRMLAEASDPAYLDEIRRANSLLHFFDPSHQAEKTPLLADSGMGAQATRKVDDAGLKGTRLVRKEDRDDDYLPAVKKGKKGKKGGAAAAAESSTKGFNCPPSVIEDCAFMGIDPPASSADVPGVVEKVKAKLEHWKSDQAAQTQRVSTYKPVVSRKRDIRSRGISRSTPPANAQSECHQGTEGDRKAGGGRGGGSRGDKHQRCQWSEREKDRRQGRLRGDGRAEGQLYRREEERGGNSCLREETEGANRGHTIVTLFLELHIRGGGGRGKGQRVYFSRVRGSGTSCVFFLGKSKTKTFRPGVCLPSRMFIQATFLIIARTVS